MGLSSSKQKTTTTPVYGQQLEGAANSVTNAYNTTAPGLAKSAGMLSDMVPGMIERYTAGDPNITAARSYDQDVLGGKYLGSGNPYLQQQIDATNGDVRNGVAALLGTRGLTGGSDFTKLITDALAKNETALRYGDYSSERGRMDAAAGRSGSYAAADSNGIQSIIAAMSGQLLPTQAAAGMASSVGGLLGQYTNQETKSSPSIGMLLAQMAGQAAQTYAMGGFGGSGH